MNKIFLQSIGLFLVFAVVIALLWYFDVFLLSQLLAIILLGLSAGFFAILMFGYYVPSPWVFKNRFYFYGMISGVGVFLLSFLSTLGENQSYSNLKLIMMLITAIAMGILLFSPFLMWNYKYILKNTILDLADGEYEVLSDSASFTNEDVFKTGRLILTNHRLIFLANDEDKSSYFLESKGNLLKTELWNNKLGIPAGIMFGSDTIIKLRFPKLWLKTIKQS